MTTAALVGLGAGALHAVTGPDHVLALAPLSLGRRRAWTVGLRWGLGHALGTLAVALVAATIAKSTPLPAMARWGDLLGGMALVATGLLALRRLARARRAGTRAGGPDHAAVGVGLVHGVAGGAALIMLLPAIVSPSWLTTAAYLGGFSLGSTAAMAALAQVLSRTVGAGAGSGRLAALTRVVALASLALGLAWTINVAA